MARDMGRAGTTWREPAVEVECIGGNCPVQAEGTVDGVPFYFRARGKGWSLSIGGGPVDGAAAWEHEQWYGRWPDAGWMPEEEAMAFIRAAAVNWAAGWPGGRRADHPALAEAHRLHMDASRARREEERAARDARDEAVRRERSADEDARGGT